MRSRFRLLKIKIVITGNTIEFLIANNEAKLNTSERTYGAHEKFSTLISRAFPVGRNSIEGNKARIALRYNPRYMSRRAGTNPNAATVKKQQSPDAIAFSRYPQLRENHEIKSKE